MFYCRLLKPSTSSSPWPWMTKFMKETVRFHFGTQMKPEKRAKDDTGPMVLKNDSNRIQTKHAHWFHICGDAANMPFNTRKPLPCTWQVHSLACSSRRDRVLWHWTIPSSSQGNSDRYHPYSKSNSQHSGRGCHSRSLPSQQNTLQWWTLCIFSMVATSYMWLLSIWNVANGMEELNF